MSSLSNLYYPTGGITYWSVYHQQWIPAACAADIPDHELAAMSADEREAIAAHAVAHAAQED